MQNSDMQLGTNSSQQQEDFQRCKCNKLLCVIKGDDVEIKCNKCKRVMTIKTKGILDVEVK